MDKINLINKAKTNDPEAVELLFNQYKPIVLKLSQKYYLKDFDQDDWLQEGRIICHLSALDFCPSKGVSFGAYFKVNFERAVIGLVRRQEALKRRSIRYAESLESPLHVAYVRESIHSLIGVDYIFVRDSLSDFGSRLSDLERNVFTAYLDGCEKEEISQKLSLEMSQVVGALSRARIKLKEEI